MHYAQLYLWIFGTSYERLAENSAEATAAVSSNPWEENLNENLTNLICYLLKVGTMIYLEYISFNSNKWFSLSIKMCPSRCAGYSQSTSRPSNPWVWQNLTASFAKCCLLTASLATFEKYIICSV